MIMINQYFKDNTEPSLRGNSSEGVETETQAYGNKSMAIMGRSYSVTDRRECRATCDASRRYSPNLLVTIGVEVNNTQPQSKDWSNNFDQDALEQIQREQDKVWKRLVDAAQTVYNDSFLFNTFTPTVYASMQNQIMRWGIPVHMAIISFDLWPDIVADTEFSTWFDPVNRGRLVA